MTTDRPLTRFTAVAEVAERLIRRRPASTVGRSPTSPRNAVVDRFENGFWIVQLDPPGCIDIELLRPWQFRFSATNPQGSGRDIFPGQKVVLHYIRERNSGLWYAYPATPEATAPS